MSRKLSKAATQGNLAVVKALAARLNASSLDKQDRKSGDTALIQAAKYGHHLCVQVLVENGADVNVKNHAGYTALFMSVDKGYFECVKVLVEHGAAINHEMKISEFGDGTTALIKCCWRCGVESFNENHFKCARLLVENGANVNCQTSKGNTALNISARYGIPSLVKLLLEHKATLNVRDELGNTEVMLSTAQVSSPRSKSNFLACLDILVKHGGDINSKNTRGDTPLIACIRDPMYPRRRTLSVSQAIISHAKFLLDNGADPNAKGHNGDTLLILSVQQKNFAYVKLLLLEKYGTDLSIQNKAGDTALICGARSGSFNCLHLLLESGRSHMNIQDKLGNTALITSIKSGHFECAKLLVQNGADVNIRNHAGLMAIDLCVSADMHELLKAYAIIPEAEPLKPPMVPSSVAVSVYESDTEHQYDSEVSRWLVDNGLGFLAYNATYHELNSFEDTKRLTENELFSMLLVKSEKHKNILRHSPFML